MYDPRLVLAAIDAHKWQIIALCSLAMLCNYIYFISAVRQGFRDRVFPVPMFCTFFWLAGDGSMVARYDLWFNVYDHWYLKLFWAALVLTVLCELVFLYMLLKFGRNELLPSWTQSQFRALVFAGLIVSTVVWVFVKEAIRDDLYITYFHLANMAGPLFGAAQVIRRRSTAGTNPLIWSAYTVMVASWFTACALWFGPPFASSNYLALYAACTLSAAAMAIFVRRMSPQAIPSGVPVTG
jgi:hypothetical protein